MGAICAGAVAWGAMLVCLTVTPVAAQEGTTNGEWRSYAGDVWGTKYSPLDQITASNFDTLEVVWRWRTADALLPYETEQGVSLVAADTLFARLEEADPDRWVTRPGIGRLSATPLMAGGVLYLATPLYQGAAVDARTGVTRWVHNPRVYEEGSPPLPSPWNHRGVAYWERGAEARVVWGTGESRERPSARSREPKRPAPAIAFASPRGR
jgi:quinoprotein glucose dehydrogenase